MPRDGVKAQWKAQQPESRRGHPVPPEVAHDHRAARHAVQLAYFDGQTYRQVAETLGIPEGTAKSRLRLALRRIAATLEAGGGAW